LGLVSNSASLIEIDTDPPGGPPDKTYTLNFYDYADRNGIQARVYYKDIDPYLQIWLVQYSGFVAGQPAMLEQQDDEPLKIDGNEIAALATKPAAMVMFADDNTPDATISVLRCCPHPPSAAGTVALYDHNCSNFSACHALSDTNNDWYELMPA
jgi:hypothetical protein